MSLLIFIDKERVCAAMENPSILMAINRSLKDTNKLITCE